MFDPNISLIEDRLRFSFCSEKFQRKNDFNSIFKLKVFP